MADFEYSNGGAVRYDSGRINLEYELRPLMNNGREELISSFTASLEKVNVDWSICQTDTLHAEIFEVTEPPAVSTPFETYDISFASLDIDIEVLTDHAPSQLTEKKTGITLAMFGIAEYGSLILRIDDVPGTESASLFVDSHVAILAASDILPDMTQAMTELGPIFREQNASAIIATGPSATADMGALVYGAHGPMSVHVIILEDQ